LGEWAAYRKRFQGTVFHIPAEVWYVLNELVLKKDVSYREVLTPEVQRGVLPKKIKKEKDFEERIFRNIGLLQRIGYDLVLYEGRGKIITGRQVPCGKKGGRIDLLCRARGDGNFVVIELKKVEASYHAFGQVSSYMGWVQKKIAQGVPVRGLIISRGADVRLKNALETNPNIEQRNTKELRLGTER
jgi:RecB family endonuclease NucS